jgi:nitrite reductase/ring-hydroxylating ferredoxin subunit
VNTISTTSDTTEHRDDWILASDKPLSTMTFPLRLRINGESVVVFQTQHGLRGVEKACPHQGASWMMGELISDETMLRCPLHSFTFRLRDGKGVNCPGLKIKVFDVKEEADQLYIRLPASEVNG